MEHRLRFFISFIEQIQLLQYKRFPFPIREHNRFLLHGSSFYRDKNLQKIFFIAVLQNIFSKFALSIPQKTTGNDFYSNGKTTRT